MQSYRGCLVCYGTITLGYDWLIVVSSRLILFIQDSYVFRISDFSKEGQTISENVY